MGVHVEYLETSSIIGANTSNFTLFGGFVSSLTASVKADVPHFRPGLLRLHSPTGLLARLIIRFGSVTCISMNRIFGLRCRRPRKARTCVK